MMRRTSRVIALLIASNVSVACGTVRAQDKFKMLGERGIRATVVSMDITDGSHWSIYLRPDGALIGAESGSRWIGTWNIQKNKLCMSNPGGKELDCYEVWMSDRTISLRLKEDDDSFVGVIEKHKGS